MKVSQYFRMQRHCVPQTTYFFSKHNTLLFSEPEISLITWITWNHQVVLDPWWLYSQMTSILLCFLSVPSNLLISSLLKPQSRPTTLVWVYLFFVDLLPFHTLLTFLTH